MFSYTKTSAANHPLVPLPGAAPAQPLMLDDIIHGSVTQTVIDLLEYRSPSLEVPQLLLLRDTSDSTMTDRSGEFAQHPSELVLLAGDIDETLKFGKQIPSVQELKSTFESFAEKLRLAGRVDDLKRVRPRQQPNLTDRFQGHIVELRETLEHLEINGPGGTPNHTTLFSAQVFHDGDPLAGPYLWFDPVTARQSALEAASRILESRGEMSPAPIKVGIPASSVYLSIQAMNDARSAGLSHYIPLSPCHKHGPRGRVVKRTQTPSRGLFLPQLSRRDLTRSRDGRNQSLQLHDLDKTDTEYIMHTMSHWDAVIILSPTGSGKTTQIPQIILDNSVGHDSDTNTNIVCSQPNPSLVKSLASKVASERTQSKSVGYDLYEDSRFPESGKGITYCSTAALLKRFLEDSDDFLSSFSHIIIDDVHKSHKDTELALTLLRKSIRERKAAGIDYPKLILLGAANEASSLIKYLGARSETHSALTVMELKLGGPAFDVKWHYLSDILSELSMKPSESAPLLNDEHRNKIQDYIQKEMSFADLQAGQANPPRFDLPTFRNSPDEGVIGLVVLTVAHLITTKVTGDILVLLPSSSAINEVADLLQHVEPANVDVEDSSRLNIIKAYSQPQEAMVEPLATGCVRVILTASTVTPSVVLKDVTSVVDSGQIETTFVDHNILKAHTNRADLATNLEHTGLVRGLNFKWISQAGAQERAALAGFAKGGHYYALYTPQRQRAFSEHDVPAIHQSDLVRESLMLSAATVPYHPNQIFLEMPHPPAVEVVNDASRRLLALDALTHDKKITSLGRLLDAFSLHPAVAKALLLGALFGCLEPIMIFACLNPLNILLDRSELLCKQDLKLTGKHLPNKSSDPASDIECFRRYHRFYMNQDFYNLGVAEQQWGVDHSIFLAAKERSQQIFMTLKRLGVVPIWTTCTEDDSVFDCIPKTLNFNNENLELVRGICLNTTHPNIAMLDVSTKGEQQRWIDASSHYNEIDPLSIVHRTVRFTDYRQRLSRDVAVDPNRIEDSDNSSSSDPRSTPTSTGSGGVPVLPDALSLTRQKGKMLSYHGKRMMGLGPKSRLLAHLEQVSMLTPVIAILFHPTAALDARGHIALDGRLHIDLNVEGTMENGIASQANQILMGFRLAVDRFSRHLFSQLNVAEAGNLQEGGGSNARNRASLATASLFEDKRRYAMIDSVVKVLADDEAYRQSPRRDHSLAAKQAVDQMVRTEAALSASDDTSTHERNSPDFVPTSGKTARATRAQPANVTAEVHQLTLQLEQDEQRRR